MSDTEVVFNEEEIAELLKEFDAATKKSAEILERSVSKLICGKALKENRYWGNQYDDKEKEASCVFLSAMLLRMPRYPTLSVPTMATDGFQIVYNPFWVTEIGASGDAPVIGVLAHEAFHVAFKHPLRMTDKDPQIFNMAGDCAINSELKRTGFRLPSDGTFAENFGFPEGLDADSYYDLLMAMAKKCKCDGQGEGNGKGKGPSSGPPQTKQKGKGSGAPQEGKASGGSSPDEKKESDEEGDEKDDETPDPNDIAQAKAAAKEPRGKDVGQRAYDQKGDDWHERQFKAHMEDPIHDPGRCGGIFQPEKLDEATRIEMERQIDEAVLSAATVAKDRGTIPGGIARLVNAARNAEVDWRTQLREFLRTTIPTDYRWIPCNRRFIGSDLYLPGMNAESLGHVAIAIDTSGSIGAAELAAFAAEVDACLMAYPCKATIIWCDAVVTQVKEWQTADGDLKPLLVQHPGGGGTDHNPVFQYIDRNCPDVTVLVALTDGFTCFPKAPNYPVLWTLTKQSTDPKNIPFGRVVKMQKA